MKDAEKFLVAWANLPESVKERKATVRDLEAFELTYGVIPSSYRWFLINCGGGPIGPDYIDGIDALSSSHQKYIEESNTPNGWKAEGFIIGWDGAGNPILIDRSGVVVVEDHNFGGINEVSKSFEIFLEERLFKAT